MLSFVSALLTLGHSSHKLSPAAHPSEGNLTQEGVPNSFPARAPSLRYTQLCQLVC
eukprot:IDg7320t1